MSQTLPVRPDPETDVPQLHPHDWLLTFTNDNANASDGDGRPWGDGTAIAARAGSGLAPWDEDCLVRPMIGGDRYFKRLCATFEAAIEDAKARPDVPGESKGHVYITGLQLNALRDLSSNYDWLGQRKWDPSKTVEKDQTVLGFLLRMMAVGIDVRLLLWMPTTRQATWPASFGPLAAEHWSIAAAIEDFDAKLGDPAPGRGIVALDLRTAGPLGAALHQKLVVVRVGQVNVAYCGGIDLAYTRRDSGRADDRSGSSGDWQSGDTTPLNSEGWPKQTSIKSASGVEYEYPEFPSWDWKERFPEDLPATVYGKGNRQWHDQALELQGPIVTTLEEQFIERWRIPARVFKFNRKDAIGRDDQVQVTQTGPDGMPPLPPAAETPPAGDATVQMWRTIPLLQNNKKGPLKRGEFTIMAGIAKSVARATELITIWDQYFWSEPLARLLARRLMEVPTLRLVIVLPPYGTAVATDELALRKAALQTLWNGLDDKARERVKVFDLWDRMSLAGIYVHAKVQTYDDQVLVCGSANMNRRSFECDAELDCAVHHEPIVREHLRALYTYVMGREADSYPFLEEPGYLKTYWDNLKQGSIETRGGLIDDPFWAADPGTPKTPNGVEMPSTRSSKPYSLFEPSSIINGYLGDRTCPHGCPGEPKKPGHLDQMTFLLEHCHDGDNWPFREPTDRW